MLDLFLLIICGTLLAYVIESRTYKYATPRIGIAHDGQSRCVYIVLIIWTILFAGLRSAYNDTGTYMSAFNYVRAGNISITELFENYGGFNLYQRLIKTYITDNPQMMIFISALITCGLTIPFIVKHTKHFCASIFLFFIGDFVFMMAGIKQAIAIAIALYAIDAYLKRKYVKAAIILLLAMTFHPYIICLGCLILLKDRMWNKKTVLMIVVFAFLFTNLELVFGLLGAIGKDYSTENFSNYTINPMRVVVEAIPIVISFIYRNKLRVENDEWLTLGINMRIISFTFIFLGLFFNPIYLGRMATYFSMLSAITIPHMLNVAFRGEKNGKLFTLGYYALFAVYFLLDCTKLGAVNVITHDHFRHVNITQIF